MSTSQMTAARHLCVGLMLVLGLAPMASAQQSAPAPAGPPPQQVPLSGRGTSPGSVVATETAVPGPTTGVNTLNPVVDVQGAFRGATNSTRGRPFSGSLSFREAIERGLAFNLGAVDASSLVKQARGLRGVARSALLPNLVGNASVTAEQFNLAAIGVQGTPIPGFSFPTVTGPFSIYDLRARLSQAVVDRTAWQNFRSASATARADELTIEDTRDLIVLAVGGTYLQTLATGARLESARAQLETANALYQQNAQRRAVGIVAQLDVDRSQVQALSQQQRLLSLEADFAKQKINLARMVGLPPVDSYNLGDRIPFSAAPPLTLDDALQQAREQRADLKAAAAQVEAAERALAAARAERLPTVTVNADVGALGNTPASAQLTYAVVGAVRVPIWLGGRISGEIQQAEAAVTQRRGELEDLTSQIEGDVRKSFLDLRATTTQVEVADRNRQVAAEALTLTRQRFDAGVSDNVEVIQAQEALSNAELDYINSIFSHNVAKLGLARAIGQTAERVSDFVPTGP
jgi:outer membrane protein TolC